MRWTKIYLICLVGGIPVFAFFGLIEIHPLELNEVGDFLAGAFGPLALFWVVLGFFQQGEELQNSVDALHLQAREMRASVEQQKAMLEVTREAIEHEKVKLEDERVRLDEASKPLFSVSFEKPKATGLPNLGVQAYVSLGRLQIHNAGGPVTLVNLSLETEHSRVAYFTLNAIGSGSTATRDFGDQNVRGNHLRLAIEYTRGNGQRERQVFQTTSVFGISDGYSFSKTGETQRI
ncbi:hypothetical protein [Pseudooceanicola sp. 200-1SW]|uniref:hypothetical protein n=1 Tax=Pseudooceanicola sp. 200-1SW TaxID=3425949 RepID=UPI003D7FAAC3